jgi:hypothetical protein
MARCSFGIVPLFFAMPEDAPLGRLEERVADWMNQRGQGPDWMIEGGARERIEFDFEYGVIPSHRGPPVKIYLKQEELEVAPSLSWISLSDQLVKKKGLPRGTLFRIYPVTGSIKMQKTIHIRSSGRRRNNIGMRLSMTKRRTEETKRSEC